jgi:addiction module HigA family antidote
MSVQRRDSAGWAVHPGEILREEFMKPREMSSYHLAKKLHVSTPTVNDIVLERRAVTA